MALERILRPILVGLAAAIISCGPVEEDIDPNCSAGEYMQQVQQDGFACLPCPAGTSPHYEAVKGFYECESAASPQQDAGSSDIPPTSNPYTAESFESTNAYCSDGVDNNEDGFTDCAAFSCTYNPFVTVCGSNENNDERCSDGEDNNNNNYSDCQDFSCLGSPFVTVCDGENTYERCTDGLDNDGNGYTDCADYGCSKSLFFDACD